MNTRKMLGIALMVAFAGAFVAWSLLGPAAMPGAIQRSLVSALLAGGIFLVWRLLVWEKPRKRL